MTGVVYDKRTVASLMLDIDKQLAHPNPDVVKVGCPAVPGDRFSDGKIRYAANAIGPAMRARK